MKRIIIIDDALDVARLLRSAILTIDPTLEVSVVPSGEEAMLEVYEGQPDLVIADVHLPGISGFDLIRKLINRFGSLQIIVITGSEDPEVEKQARELAVSAFLHKPMEIDLFIDAVRKALGIASLKTGRPGESKISIETPQPDEAASLSRIVANLGVQVNARAVVLLNDHANIVALYGSLPGLDFETAWAPDLVKAAAAGEKIGSLAEGKIPPRVSFWKGERWLVTVLPAGSFTLAVIHPAKKGTNPVSKNFELFLSVQQDLGNVLGGLNIPAVIPPSEPPMEAVVKRIATSHVLQPFGTEEDLQQLKKFQDLFDKKKVKFKKQDADEFWNQKIPLNPADPVRTSHDLSYDQARKLGFTPEEGGD